MIIRWILPLLFLIVLSGCSGVSGEHDFSEKINAIEQALDEADWKQLESLSNEFDQLYKQSKWKVQLMGDEGEYENLQESINHLIVAIEEQDITETKLELSSIKIYLNHIYSL